MTADTWQQKAACRGINPDLFFPDRGENTTNAKHVCAGCPVTDDCLMYAIVNLEISGIWGGKDGKERRVIRRQLIANGTIAASELDRRSPHTTGPVQCGTRSGYVTHRRLGQVPCDDCTEANRDYQNDYKARHGNRTRHIECGTHAGYRAHLRRDEPACEPCRAANTARVNNDRMAGAA